MQQNWHAGFEISMQPLAGGTPAFEISENSVKVSAIPAETFRDELPIEEVSAEIPDKILKIRQLSLFSVMPVRPGLVALVMTST